MEQCVKYLLFLGIVFGFIVKDVILSKCSISKDWTELSMEERLLMSDIVVYGKTKEHRANVRNIGGKSYYEIDAVFDVYCVLEAGEDPITEEIIIERVAPRDGCSGTKEHMKIGEEAIVSLQMSYGGKYQYDEVMPTQSATFAATKDSLYTIASLCNMQLWTSPLNATVDRCPICGRGEFSKSVMEGDQKKTNPCLFDGINFLNDTNCNMFASSSLDADSVCIPQNTLKTCTRIVYQAPKVTCECTGGNDHRNVDLSGFGDIDAALNVLPCLITIFISFVCVFLAL
jgi:hypothetical protein